MIGIYINIMLGIEKNLINRLYRNKIRKTIVCEDKKILTTTTQQYKLDSILKYIKKLSQLRNGEKIYYVEIGVKYGGVLNYILENTNDIDINVIGIDLFEDFVVSDINTHYGDICNRNKMIEKLGERGFHNVELKKGDSSIVLKTLSKMKNVVCFIDGNHTYNGVEKDYYGILDKMENGYVIFDDIEPLWVGVRKFYNELSDKIKIETHPNYGIVKVNI